MAQLGQRGLAIAWLLLMQTQAVYAAPSPELKQVLRDVIAWVPGAYDSAPQIAFERVNGFPPDGEHDRQYRVFAKIDAPHLGEYVFYSQIRAGGKEGPVIQQVVFLTEIDEENNGVTFNGRRIKDPESFVDAHKHPDIWATIGPDPRFGGTCNFYWRRHNGQLKGTLNDGTCTMMSRDDQQMTWHTEWVLGPDELWVYDNGYYDDGSLVTGRSDKTHLRLYKASEFTCTATDGDDNSARVSSTTIHDRGGLARLPYENSDGSPQFLELIRGPDIFANGRIHETTRLLLYDEDPLDTDLPTSVASASADGNPGLISLQYDDRDVSCLRNIGME